MDLELKHLGETLAVGGFAIYGLYRLVSLANPTWTSAFAFLSNRDHQLHESAMILALVFAAGILVEGISKNVSSGRDDGLISVPLDYLLDTDKELRLRSLFEVEDDSKAGMTIKLLPIYRDLMMLNHQDQTFIKHSQVLESQFLPAAEGQPDLRMINHVNGSDRRTVRSESVQTLKTAVNGIFYTAKNRVYQEDNYFSELEDIEHRADFSRALASLCLICAIFYSVPGVIGLLPKELEIGFGVRTRRRLIWFMIIAYLVGAYLARESYRSETTNYNLRVFGYYSSIVSGAAIGGGPSSTSTETPDGPVEPTKPVATPTPLGNNRWPL